MAAEAEERRGRIDVLVNSAGITHRGPAVEYREAEWDQILEVNLTGYFLGLPGGRPADDRARALSSSSTRPSPGAVGLARTVAYTSTKGGVKLLTRALAVEWGPRTYG